MELIMAMGFGELSGLFLCSCFFIWWLIRIRSSSSRAPPGPPPLPVVGHLHLLARTAPNIVFTQLAQRYGPILSLRFGSVPIVVVSTREAVKEIFKNNDVTFASRPPSVLGRILHENYSDLGLAPYGERWRQLRRICSVELFHPRVLTSFGKLRIDEVRSLLSSLRSSSLSGQALDVRASLTTLAFNHICQVIMRKKYYGQIGEKNEEGQAFIHLIDQIFELGGAFPVGEYLPYLRWLDIGKVERRMTTVAKAAHSFVEKIILERQEKPKELPEADDFLDVLLRLREQGESVLQGNTVKLLVIDMLTAGSDTISVTLEWSLAELIKHPFAMTRLQDEIRSVVGMNRLVEENDIPSLHFLRAVVKETFRLHPPGALLLPHYSTKACKVMGYEIQESTTLIFNIYAVGRDAEIWEGPLEFRPERMLDRSVDFRGQDFELIPFGAGRRICPGMSMAAQLVHLTLANLVHVFDWKMPPGKEVDTINESYGVTVLMANKLQAIPVPRLEINLDKATI